MSMCLCVRDIRTWAVGKRNSAGCINRDHWEQNKHTNTHVLPSLYIYMSVRMCGTCNLIKNAYNRKECVYFEKQGLVILLNIQNLTPINHVLVRWCLFIFFSKWSTPSRLVRFVLVTGTDQQKRWPLPQSTAGAWRRGKLSGSEVLAPGPCPANRTALSQPALGHHRMAGLFSTNAWGTRRKNSEEKDRKFEEVYWGS